MTQILFVTITNTNPIYAEFSLKKMMQVDIYHCK